MADPGRYRTALPGSPGFNVQSPPCWTAFSFVRSSHLPRCRYGQSPDVVVEGIPEKYNSESVRTAAPRGTPEPDTIAVFSMGRATVLQGSVRGQRLMAVGKVGEAELLDLIESALP